MKNIIFTLSFLLSLNSYSFSDFLPIHLESGNEMGTTKSYHLEKLSECALKFSRQELKYNHMYKEFDGSIMSNVINNSKKDIVLLCKKEIYVAVEMVEHKGGVISEGEITNVIDNAFDDAVGEFLNDKKIEETINNLYQ